jgi:hypothetical protein
MTGTKPEEPGGDYGYDLVHEPDVAVDAETGAHAAPVDLGGPPRREPEGDYGYDEAHDG